jgi:hypothetical protein
LEGRRSFRWFKDFLECNLNLNPQMLSPKNHSVSKSSVIHPKGSHHPAICSQTWLFLSAVIRCYSAAVQPKKRGFPRWMPAPSLFFPGDISENSGGFCTAVGSVSL